MSATFEGSYLGDSARIENQTRLECGICWWVYDPEIGDDGWQIPAGTPFSRLPRDWRCPVCDAEKSKFMALGVEGDPAAVALPASARTMMEAEAMASGDLGRIAALASAYRAADARMRGLPVHNPKLVVDMVGFRRQGELLVGIAVTPWCMNLVVAPPDGTGAPDGATVTRGFPSGAYDFVGGELGGFGRVETCSLFSPMDEFDDPAVARMTAEAAMTELMTPPPTPKPECSAPKTEPTLSRRSLFAPVREGAMP